MAACCKSFQLFENNSLARTKFRVSGFKTIFSLNFKIIYYFKVAHNFRYFFWAKMHFIPQNTEIRDIFVFNPKSKHIIWKPFFNVFSSNWYFIFAYSVDCVIVYGFVSNIHFWLVHLVLGLMCCVDRRVANSCQVFVHQTLKAFQME